MCKNKQKMCTKMCKKMHKAKEGLISKFSLYSLTDGLRSAQNLEELKAKIYYFS